MREKKTTGKKRIPRPDRTDRSNQSDSPAPAPAPASRSPLIVLRPYQLPVFEDRSTGVSVLFWSRQIGKSFVLASWAVDRLLSRPGRLVTVLSNSRENGAELNLKCGEVCRKLDVAFEQADLSPDLTYENMTMETRIHVGNQVGRIKVLAANSRTARGFSGDLILDEFAFHEQPYEIWSAAEPILSSNPDFLCRIASTPNGTHNLFYEMVTSGLYPVSTVRRSDAYAQGLRIYDPVTRKPVTPAEARAKAIDKRAYDQNYELVWADENMALLTHALINACEDAEVGEICEGRWTQEAIDRMTAAKGDLFVGVDVGRTRDITVITVIERLGSAYLVRGILRLENMRLPDQQRHLDVVCACPKFRAAAVDITGIGLGLCEYAQERHGLYRVEGINFATTIAMPGNIERTGRKAPTVRITEAMATDLLEVYEDKAVRHPVDVRLRDDLRKPEKVVSPNGRVSIAASRDGRDHADHFWSLALAVRMARGAGGRFTFERVTVPGRQRLTGRHRGVLV